MVTSSNFFFVFRHSSRFFWLCANTIGGPPPVIGTGVSRSQNAASPRTVSVPSVWQVLAFANFRPRSAVFSSPRGETKSPKLNHTVDESPAFPSNFFASANQNLAWIFEAFTNFLVLFPTTGGRKWTVLGELSTSPQLDKRVVALTSFVKRNVMR